MTDEAKKLLHLTSALLAVLMLPVREPPQVVPEESGASVRLARDSHPKSSKEADDHDMGLDRSYSAPKGSRVGRGVRSPSGRDDPKRIQRFWRQYRFAKPEPKSKPLDREK